MKDSKLCANCSASLEDFYAECLVCMELYLCLNCFSTDLNFKDHKSSHNYTIIDSSGGKNSSLFCDEDEESWTIGEELVLLESVEHYGFGSWIDVSGHVKSKSDLECESHYLKYYMEGNIGQSANPRVQSLTVEEQKELGYMVLRDDFDKEFDNEAETSICDICLHYTDSAIDIKYSTFKVSQLQERLKERLKRKHIGKQHNLLHDSTSYGFKTWCVQRKKRSREFKSFQTHYLAFSKYMHKKAFIDLHKNISRQERLMRHIRMLKKLKERGCASLHGNFRKINYKLNGVSGRRKKVQKSYK